eukprot:CAMPEP_0198287700 /NCGR_PEP_ID=MMETSP1449-20131203/6420_1 /TAXON_ID=420275 /ORGANISM="Attheya septentrionalis, Strain CCMP2084" /LENGTH=96 /DNA_ID=CAMNT_0043985685 /DNA_START=32 /DNA_END=320 /DNA_ORIENTATION=+
MSFRRLFFCPISTSGMIRLFLFLLDDEILRAFHGPFEMGGFDVKYLVMEISSLKAKHPPMWNVDDMVEFVLFGERGMERNIRNGRPNSSPISRQRI